MYSFKTLRQTNYTLYNYPLITYLYYYAFCKLNVARQNVRLFRCLASNHSLINSGTFKVGLHSKVIT